jgi:microcystin-dependent protein
MKAPVSFDNFPTFAANGSRDMNPESAKYSVGFVPADTFPAEWANYMFHGATKGVSDLNTAVASIWAENANVLTQAGITPAAENNGQLYSAIMKFINDAVLTANQQVLAQAKLDAHPVGSLYWSSSPTDPATLFGGTWTRIKDRFVLAAGDTYGNGATGGAATVKLTESNLPAHKHYIDLIAGAMTENESHFHGLPTLLSPEGADSISGFAEGTMLSQWGRWGVINSTTSYKDIPHRHYVKGDSNSTGDNTAHENMPPYVVKYCWERIS